MGFEIERFVSEIDETLICGNCLKVLENPKMLTSCRHIMCFNCIEKSVIIENQCPLDQIHVDAADIEEAPKHILEYVSQLRIKCDFYEHGCKEAIPLNKLLLHRLNCGFHTERKTKCNDCGIETEKFRFKDHNCVSVLKSRLDSMREQIDGLNRLYLKEIMSLKSQMQRRDRETDCFRRFYVREGVNACAERQMISFSCITDTQSGAHEMIFIQTIHLTLECEANVLTKVGQIKYNACSIVNTNTTDFSLYHNGHRLEDHNYMSFYNIHNGSICHLLPNELYITFDCVDIKLILSFSVRTNDKIESIIRQLHNHLRNQIPEQLFLFLIQCSSSLYLKDTKLEDTYELSNYDVLAIKTLKYCNRVPMDV